MGVMFPKWLKERNGIVVYENHMLDSSSLGDKTFIPARYVAENNQRCDAPEQWRPNGGLPSLRQEKVDHVKLEDFGGDLNLALKCFVKEESKEGL
jgi:hypothetical protein